MSDNFKKILEEVLNEKSQVAFFVDKAFMKGMHDSRDQTLKDWLDVPELSKAEQKKAFKLIRTSKDPYDK